MSIWEMMKSWWGKEAKHNIAVTIAADRVDTSYDAESIESDLCYVRVWVVEMFLTHSRRWFTDVQPAVHGLLKLKYADHEVEVARVAAPSKADYARGQAVLKNYALLDLAPFRGGTLEVEAGLVSMKGTDHVAVAIDVISGFSQILATPLSSAIAVAKQVKSSADKLFGAEAAIHLAYHNSFVTEEGDNRLRAGYFAIIRGEDGAFDKTKLRVNEGGLYLDNGAAAERFVGYDYMLLRIERVASRSDLAHFTEFEPLRKAVLDAAVADDVKLKIADATFVAKVLTHPELIDADRRRLIKRIREEVEEIKGGFGGQGAPEIEWREFATALPPATDFSRPTFDEFVRLDDMGD